MLIIIHILRMIFLAGHSVAALLAFQRFSFYKKYVLHQACH